jgi:hypothetical protein
MSGMVGQHIGKYRVTQQVGRGGMGTVYCAVDETLHRDVAIKVLNAGLDDPTVARRFRAEAITVARLNHPGIATIYELVQHDGQWLMVMEFVRGETLERTLAEQGPLPPARAAELTMQLLAALAHAHSLGVVHRDLKPANIMLTAGGVKIMDFGIARVAGAEQLTSAGFMMGTPAYMAPEQVLGAEIDARTDLYAVGIVLFQMVSGAMPFAGTTPVQVAQARINEAPASLSTVKPDLPAWLAQVVDIALSRDPDRRFQSAMLFREAVRRGLAGLPIEAPDPSAASASITAGPGVLRVVKGEKVPPAPRSTAPPPAAMPTMAGPVPVPVPSRGQSAEPIERPARGLSPVVIAGALAGLLAIGAGAWFLMRAPSDPAPAQAVATSPGAPPVSDSAVNPAPAPQVATEVAAGLPSRSSAPSPTAGSPPAPVPARGPAASPTRTDASPGAAAPPSGGRAAGTPAATAAATPAAAPASALFRGVRALVVTGRRAQERPAVLTFADGAVTLFDDSGRTPLVALPYREVTSAAYTHDRDPRWYPTLAGPPVDVDMPGGLFRGDRHWLALQSRESWMIIRMNDGDWRPITEAVTALLGLDVQELRP